jgi:ankyrin repeat protein
MFTTGKKKKCLLSNINKHSAKTGSIGCLEALVNEEEINLDIQNRLEGETPLHLAVKYANEDPEMADALVELLLAGGADLK